MYNEFHDKLWNMGENDNGLTAKRRIKQYREQKK